MHETIVSFASAGADVRAIVHRPDVDRPLPGVVMVAGAGEVTAEDWDGRPAMIASCGAVVLSHDKPGCGESAGDWRSQSFLDRAHETLAAHALLRDQSGVDPERVGLHGVSQGGWVSYLAASMAPATVRQVVAISAPGVSAAKQERHRLAVLVDDDEEALAWVDERTERLIAGDDPESILADQLAHSDRPWYRVVCDVYVAEWLPFFARNAAFDPATVLPDVRCPVFAAFGGADATVPVPQSISRLIELLPPNPRHAFAVFPNAGHSLCVGQRDSAIPLAEQLAPGFLPMLSEWFATC